MVPNPMPPLPIDARRLARAERLMVAGLVAGLIAFGAAAWLLPWSMALILVLLGAGILLWVRRTGWLHLAGCLARHLTPRTSPRSPDPAAWEATFATLAAWLWAQPDTPPTAITMFGWISPQGGVPTLRLWSHQQGDGFSTALDLPPDLYQALVGLLTKGGGMLACAPTDTIHTHTCAPEHTHHALLRQRALLAAIRPAQHPTLGWVRREIRALFAFYNQGKMGRDIAYARAHQQVMASDRARHLHDVRVAYMASTQPPHA